MVGVEEGREFRFRGDLYSQESTFPLVIIWFYKKLARHLGDLYKLISAFFPVLVSRSAATNRLVRAALNRSRTRRRRPR